MTALSVTQVSKSFGDVTAVDSVSFELDDQEILALVGPSGCGKSTLLRLVAGLHRSDTGSIVLAGTTVDDADVALPPEQRRIGLVFQEHALFPHLSVAKNVEFGIRKAANGRARVGTMLELVGLEGFGDRYPHELSGGERQRVALARALAPEPALMLLDEPFASLDPNLRTRIRDDVVAILRATGTPAVIVTHDQPEALAIGDRIAVMRNGLIAQLDRPADVFHTPIDRFVATFMGEADFVDLATARAELAVNSTTATDAAEVMIRPADVTFIADEHGRASIVRAEFRGSAWCYTLRLSSGAEVRSIGAHHAHVGVGTRVTPSVTNSYRPLVIDPAS